MGRSQGPVVTLFTNRKHGFSWLKHIENYNTCVKAATYVITQLLYNAREEGSEAGAGDKPFRDLETNSLRLFLCI